MQNLGASTVLAQFLLIKSMLSFINCFFIILLTFTFEIKLLFFFH